MKPVAVVNITTRMVSDESVSLVMTREQAEVIHKLTRQVAGAGKKRAAASAVGRALMDAGVDALDGVAVKFEQGVNGFSGAMRFVGDVE